MVHISDYKIVKILALLKIMDSNENVFRYIAPLPAICYMGG
jgi:hypothetical protein